MNVDTEKWLKKGGKVQRLAEKKVESKNYIKRVWGRASQGRNERKSAGVDQWRSV